jgi:TPR repeat protein
MPRKDPIARAEYQKVYAQKNRVKAYQNVKKWRAANPEKRKEQSKRYAKKHPDVIKAKTARWRKSNPEKAAAMDNLNAINSLGLCYEEGNGVEIDIKKALSWSSPL